MDLIYAIILGIFTSVIANIFAPKIQQFFKIKLPLGYEPPKAAPPVQNEDLDPHTDAWRKHNRDKLDFYAWQTFITAFPFIVLCMAFYMPMAMETGFGHNALDLSTTRLGISYKFEGNKLLGISVILALLLYYPTWRLARKISDILSRILSRYSRLNYRRYSSFVALAIMLFSFLIAGHVIYILVPTMDYQTAIFTPFAVIAVAAIFSQSDGPRR